MTLIRLLPILFCCSALAQVNLIIEDKTGNGFVLGINGYMQNTDPVKELVIQKLDTFPFEVHVELAPKASFQKKLHFHESGTYRYIITTNSRDELQLRYRGKTDQFPSAAITMNVQHILPFHPLAASAVTTNKPGPTTPEPAPTKSAAVTVKEITEKLSKPQNNQPKADSVTIVKPVATSTQKPKDTAVEKPVTSAPSPEPVKAFETFLAELKITEFEFEKLNKTLAFAEKHNFKADELKQVFGIMKYDNTRLELLRKLKPELMKADNLAILRDALEYEISKQQFNDIIKL